MGEHLQVMQGNLNPIIRSCHKTYWAMMPVARFLRVFSVAKLFKAGISIASLRRYLETRAPSLLSCGLLIY
jgi:hypothetical protein